MRVPFSPHPHQCFLSLVFVTIAILTGVRWHLIVVLICISPVISYVDYLFLCWPSVCFHMCCFIPCSQQVFVIGTLVCAKSLQLYPTVCNPMDCSPLGSFVHGILQVILGGLPCPPPGLLPDPEIEPIFVHEEIHGLQDPVKAAAWTPHNDSHEHIWELLGNEGRHLPGSSYSCHQRIMDLPSICHSHLCELEASEPNLFGGGQEHVFLKICIYYILLYILLYILYIIIYLICIYLIYNVYIYIYICLVASLTSDSVRLSRL